ncbi:GDSL-type esterase/lipase family protein [Ensifer adhaerens]|uniref:GDSL-type esterase/lipase family protein n=1 Tax=Ensifer adhaerens TaxID=106592 RepID=UPI0008073F52|nr:GDSL-type esterase/lipase family protein [Ensifer adhaerens]
MIKRKLGILICALIAVYLLMSPAYALLNFRDFASELPLFIRYVAIPGLLGVAFLATGLFAKPPFAIAVGVYGLSVLAALFAFEAFLTFQSISVRLAMLGQLNSAQAETVEQDKTIVRGFALGSLNRFLGTEELSTALLSGFPNSNVVLCTPDNQIIKYTADRYGFNNPDEVYDKRVDLMLLGDSFVEGFCLPPGQDIASRLRLSGFSTAGAGIRGNGPLLELATLGRFGPLLRPRHVLMVFFEGNDWENFETELRKPWLRHALSPTAHFGTQSTAQQALQEARAILNRNNSKPVNFIDILTRTAMLRNFIALQQTFTRLGLIYPKAARAMPEFRVALRRAKTLTAGWGGKFAIVYVPRVDRFIGPFSADRVFDQLRTIVTDAAAAEEIEFIDLRRALEGQPDPARLYAPDSHFNRDGAAFAADVISRHLETVDRLSRTATNIR